MAKHSKKSNNKTNEKKSKNQKAIHPINKKERTASVGRTEKTGSTTRKKPEAKLVQKTNKIFKRGTPEQLRINKRSDNTIKSSRFDSTNTKGSKEGGKRKGSSSKEFHEKQSAKLTVTKRIRTNKEGKRIKQVVKLLNPENKQITVSAGFRTNYEVDLPKGNLNKKIEAIKEDKFKWFDEPQNKFRPFKEHPDIIKRPRAVTIKIITKAGKEVYYSGGISDPDFVVNKDNVKQLIIDKVNEYKNNWIGRTSGKFAGGIEPMKGKKRQTSKRKEAAREAAQRMEEEGYELEAGEEGAETTNSYKAIFDPANIAGVSIGFIY